MVDLMYSIMNLSSINVSGMQTVMQASFQSYEPVSLLRGSPAGVGREWPYPGLEIPGTPVRESHKHS